jgi:hypothetical protein
LLFLEIVVVVLVLVLEYSNAWKNHPVRFPTLGKEVGRKTGGRKMQPPTLDSPLFMS